MIWGKQPDQLEDQEKMAGSIPHSQKLVFKHLFFDAVIIFTSIVFALILVQTHALRDILASARELELLGSFIAGMFFTTAFTTAPAMVALGEIARVDSLFGTAFWGACGSLTGDLVIYWFMKDKFSEHIMELLREEGWGRKFQALFKKKFFRWFSFLLGGLIIASPFPDELGIGIMGFSKVRMSWFVPLSFTFNFIGILVIGIVARAL